MFYDKVFLASQSPRRRELIKILFHDIECLEGASSEEPRWFQGQKINDYLQNCLDSKWLGATRALKNRAKKPEKGLLLVADTIVVQGKRVFGKPENDREAFQTLKALSASRHKVLSGLRLGLIGEGSELKILQKIVTTDVLFHKLSDSEIKAYIRSGEARDKAGAYGFQDKALRFVERIESSYMNVVGLPLQELKAMAVELGLEWKR